MLTKIKSGNFDIYTNEIIHPKEFSNLYGKEKILKEFKTKVITSSKPFATFLAVQRHSVKVKEGDYIVLRAVKDNKKFEFVSKIAKWGKFHIPEIVIRILSINNHDKITFEVMKESPKGIVLEKELIDLVELKENTTILYREDNFITVVKKRSIPITLPRFIKITPKLIELCFLIHGDGHYKSKLFFVNKDQGLHEFVLQKFEEVLRIPRGIWRARLLFNNPADQETAKEKWRENLRLKDGQFYPTISKSTLNTSYLGNLRIVIDKIIVAVVFRNIFSQLLLFLAQFLYDSPLQLQK